MLDRSGTWFLIEKVVIDKKEINVKWTNHPWYSYKSFFNSFCCESDRSGKNYETQYCWLTDWKILSAGIYLAFGFGPNTYLAENKTQYSDGRYPEYDGFGISADYPFVNRWIYGRYPLSGYRVLCSAYHRARHFSSTCCRSGIEMCSLTLLASFQCGSAHVAASTMTFSYTGPFASSILITMTKKCDMVNNISGALFFCLLLMLLFFDYWKWNYPHDPVCPPIGWSVGLS